MKSLPPRQSPARSKMSKRRVPWGLFRGLFWLVWAAPVLAGGHDAAEWQELSLAASKETRDRVLALPPIEPTDDFAFTVLVPPGSKLYDPFDPYVVDRSTLWVTDDPKGGAVYEITSDGSVATIADTDQHPPISLDVAPKSFGSFAGQIYTAAFATPEKKGGWLVPNAITCIDPATGEDTVVCHLPPNDAGEPGAGSFFARFGPEGGPFAGRLYITAATNNTLYQVSPGGECVPFFTLDRERWGSPRGIAFTPDGETMLLGTARQSTEQLNAPPEAGAATILRVAPDGTIDPEPFAHGLQQPGGMAYAPAGFGAFGGQLFVADSGGWDNEVPPTEPIASDGRLFRVTPTGALVLVASGFANPVGVALLGDRLVVSDINGDFHVGQHKIPIGFIVMFEPKTPTAKAP